MFLQFRDAEDAVRVRDSYDYDGYRLRVEFPRTRDPGGGGGGGPRGGSSSSSMGRGRGRGPPARRSQYRVSVTGKSQFQYRRIMLGNSSITFFQGTHM